MNIYSYNSLAVLADLGYELKEFSEVCRQNADSTGVLSQVIYQVLCNTVFNNLNGYLLFFIAENYNV